MQYIDSTTTHFLMVANPDGLEESKPGHCLDASGKLNAHGYDIGNIFEGNSISTHYVVETYCFRAVCCYYYSFYF